MAGRKQKEIYSRGLQDEFQGAIKSCIIFYKTKWVELQ